MVLSAIYVDSGMGGTPLDQRPHGTKVVEAISRRNVTEGVGLKLTAYVARVSTASKPRSVGTSNAPDCT